MENREVTPVSGQEHDYVGRALMNWLNQYPDFPRFIEYIAYERLSSENGMSVFATTAAYKIQDYINGSYDAQYQFSIVYRTATSDSDERLDAAEVLSNIASWAENRDKLPDLGEGKQAISVERTSPAVMAGMNDDKTEDYQILMVMTYKVRP